MTLSINKTRKDKKIFTVFIFFIRILLLFKIFFCLVYMKKNNEKSQKVPKMVTQRGVPGGPRMWFLDILGLLGAPGGLHGSQTLPQGTPDPSEPSFLMILGPFGVDFGVDF